MQVGMALLIQILYYILALVITSLKMPNRGIQQSDEILERCAKSRLESQGAAARKL